MSQTTFNSTKQTTQTTSILKKPISSVIFKVKYSTTKSLYDILMSRFTKTWILFSPGTIAGNGGYNYTTKQHEIIILSILQLSIGVLALVKYLPCVQED